MSTEKQIRIDSAKYADFDDCLTAAANEYAQANNLQGWALAPKWGDEARASIVLTVPEWAPGEPITDD